MLTNTARRFQRSCVIETVHLAFARYQSLPNKYNFENLTPNLFIWEIIKISDIDFSQTYFRKFFKTFFELPNENSFFFSFQSFMCGNSIPIILRLSKKEEKVA